MSKPFRIAVVNSHPIQYFAPLFAYLNKDPALELTALYCSNSSLRGGLDSGFKQAVKWDVDLLAGYRAVFLGKAAERRMPAGFWSLVCPEVWGEIRSGRYDGVLLHGYHYAAYVMAFLAAKSRGIPVFYRSETHLGLQRNPSRRRLRDGLLAMMFRFIDRFLAIGSANREYYLALGVAPGKIFDVPYTVDNDRFIAAAQLSQVERVDVRVRFGLPVDQPVVLYASKFMLRKHPDDVVRAVARLRGEGVQASLLLIGSGEMEQTLRSLVAELGIQESVVFGGFVNQAELPKVYAASDVFVLPSENEPWGLIVNEVMCAGIPVVVADEVGCVQDLVYDGHNGLLMKAGDVASLVTALRRLLSAESERAAMGQKSLEIIRGWNYERCRLGFVAATTELHVRDRSDAGSVFYNNKI